MKQIGHQGNACDWLTMYMHVFTHLCYILCGEMMFVHEASMPLQLVDMADELKSQLKKMLRVFWRLYRQSKTAYMTRQLKHQSDQGATSVQL